MDDHINDRPSLLESRSSIAKRAWKTRKRNKEGAYVKPRDPRSKPINGQYNPYNSGKESAKAARWRYWMLTYGRVPPEKTYSSAKKLGIYEKDELSPAQKAWVTRRKNNPKLAVTKSYNAPRKNAFRTMIVRSFKKLGGTCLALESPDFLFVKELPQTEFVIFENNEVQHKKMLGNTPSNVEKLIYADVLKISDLARDYSFSCAFLDYCKTFQAQEEDLMLMKDKLSSCKKIAFTFSLRSAHWETKGHYGYELARRLLRIFDKYEIEYGNGYHDSTTMVGLILVRKDYNRRRPKMGPSKTISLKVPLSTTGKIGIWAKERGITESEMVRRILAETKGVN